MAYIRDWKSARNATTVTTHTAEMPTHETDDVLVWIVAKDANTGGDLGTPSGWTSLDHEAGDAALRTAVFYKVATSSSETAPATTTASAAQFHSYMIAVDDADTADIFNQVASAAFGTDDQFQTGTVTTDEDDCLIIHSIAIDGNSVAGYTEPGVIFLDMAGSVGGGGSAQQLLFYDYKETAGATDAIDIYLSTTEQTNRIILAINNATSGAKPVYCGDKSSAGTVITPLFINTVQHGATPTATPSITTVGSKTLTAINAVASGTNTGSHPFATSLNGQVFAFVADPTVDGEACEIGLSPAVDLSSGFFIVSMRTDAVAGSLTDVALGSQNAGMINFADSSNNYRAFTIFGRDTNPFVGERMTAVINVDQTTTDYAESATPPTTSAIDTIQFIVSMRANNLGTLYLSDAMKVNTMVITGGNLAKPINNDSIALMGRSYRVQIIRRLGASAFLSYIPLQIGNGTDTIYFDVSGSTIQFPRISSATAGEMNYHGEANDVGISYYGVTGDTIKHTNSTITAVSGYYWSIHASATSAATWDFRGLVIVGATVTLRDVMTFNQMTFTDCLSIDASSCDLTNCIISGLTDNGDLTVNSTSTFDTCTFDTTDLASGEYMVSTTTPSIFTDCTFNGSASTGHAIRITTAGTYSFSGNIFNNYGADASTSAAIFNDSGGAVTINITGGGGTPTYRNGTSASTTINNATTVKVTVKDVDTLDPIENARVILEADTGGDLPAGESVTITRSSSTATVAHTAHGLANGDQVVIRGASQDEYNGVFTITYINANSYSYTVSGTPATPATGTITATAVLLYGLTDASGIIQDSSFAYTSDQPVTGRARKASGSPYYKTGTIVGTIISTGLDNTMLLIQDE